MSAPGATWRVDLEVPATAVPLFERGFEDRAVALSDFETETPGVRAMEMVFAAEPDTARLEADFALIAAALDIAPPAFTCTHVPPTDWLAATYTAFPPFEVGRFRIMGSHVNEDRKPGRIPLVIDAATAFGSGEHPTTKGCLQAIDRLARRLRPRRALDMGCGTGILAFAVARCMGCPVTAVDNDAESVRVARVNARANGLAGQVTAQVGQGYKRPALPGRFGLITANILAGPLSAMAGDLAHHLEPGGIAVLSGLFDRQAPRVLSAHRRHGLHLVESIIIGPWATLILTNGTPSGRSATPA